MKYRKIGTKLIRNINDILFNPNEHAAKLIHPIDKDGHIIQRDFRPADERNKMGIHLVYPEGKEVEWECLG